MKGESERLLGDLSTVASIGRQGAAAYQHRQLALSSLGIARQNAAKFTDGEVRNIDRSLTIVPAICFLIVSYP